MGILFRTTVAIMAVIQIAWAFGWSNTELSMIANMLGVPVLLYSKYAKEHR